ncbi:MAG: dihydrolipoyl dehydrogenase [Baekduia sp.]
MDVVIPDLGDFSGVPVSELLVAAGDAVEVGQPLLVLESEKSSMEIPAPTAGTLTELKIAVGDTVSAGDVVAILDAPEPNSAPSVAPSDETRRDTEPDAAAKPGRVVVIGSGPGGYAAAFRAADLGLDVTLIERYETLGGVCLNVGCIPSKALLHAAKVITESREVPGVSFADPEIDLPSLRSWKDSVVQRLTGGLAQMAKGRKVDVITGEARFTGPNTLDVGGDTIEFDHAIVAAGSTAVRLPFVPDDDRVVTSTGALALTDVPKRLLVIGGGIIGLEMACVYDALGADVTVVEMTDRLIPEADDDLVKPLQRRIRKRYAAIHTATSVDAVEAKDDGLHVTMSGRRDGTEVFDRVLVAVGRTPNGGSLGLAAAGVNVDERGFVAVDAQQRTNVPHILAIGDCTPGPMLAHKATAEGHVAAEVAAGIEGAVNDVRVIPSVAYTDPEIAWVGLTERKAQEDALAHEVATFPWTASGRAIALGATGGVTKLIHDPQTGRILGGGAAGPNAGELIAEITLAVEMGAVIEDVALTVHPHPTLSETIGLAAELADGTITDLPNPKAGARKEQA